jgi:two-component system response regulator PilR (NtrC family)
MIDDEMVRMEHLILPGQQDKEISENHVPLTSEELKEIKKHVREKAVEEIERAFVLNALERHQWNVTRAAEEVGMLRPNFQALMRKYNLRARGE